MSVQIIVGDVRERLADLPDGSVHCVVTSPPYFGLRDYGVAGQIGLESTPDDYVNELVAVFREVRRVLRDDGTLWLNLGDTYQNSKGQAGGFDPKQPARRHGLRPQDRPPPEGLKAKDLIGIPWRAAFALQADGWYLRQDIIWAKPNPMPESVTDRCTKAHEYMFLLSKSKRYYFDGAAIAESMVATNEHDATGGGSRAPGQTPQVGNRNTGRRRAAGNKFHKGVAEYERSDTEEHRTKAGLAIADRVYETRNKRSVWTVASHPFKEAHFATFPPALVEPCILAGCPIGGSVLDPFGGAGTTGLVADRLQRNAILIELNPEYAAMAERRIRGDAPLLVAV